MQKISAWLGEDGLTDVGYQLFQGTTPVGVRVTTGIVGTGHGYYEAAADFDAATFEGHIDWDSPSNPQAWAREYIEPKTDGCDWTDAEKSQVRDALGISGGKTAAIGGQLQDVRAKTNLLGTATVTFSSPVAASGNLELKRGDDYRAVDGRHLQWSRDTWPDLTGAAISFIIQNPATLQVAGAVVTGGVGTQVVRVELTSVQTAGLPVLVDKYYVQATLANGHVLTLATGECVVQAS